MLFSFHVKNILDENKNFKSKLASINNLENNQNYIVWKDGSNYVSDNIEWFKHAQMHSYYYNAAKNLKNMLKIDPDSYYIFNLSTDQFNFIDDFYNSKFNYVSIYFSFYLNEVGINNSWVQIINDDKPKSIIARSYSPRKYSAKVKVVKNTVIYDNLVNFSAYFRMNVNKLPKIIVVTTNEELEFAMNYYKKNDIKNFQILKI